MAPEQLQPLTDAISHEVSRLTAEYHLKYGMELDLAVSIDGAAGTVCVRGQALASWGPRQMLSARLDRAGLRHDTFVQSRTVVIYPSAT